MRNGYTNVPDELIEKYGLVGANIRAFVERCQALPTHMTPSVRFIAKHFKISKQTVQRHIHLIRGTEPMKRKRTKTGTPTAPKLVQNTTPKLVQTNTLQTTLKTTPKRTVGLVPQVPLANLANKDDVETASEIRHSELGTDPSKLVSRYGKSPIVDPLSDVRRLNDGPSLRPVRVIDARQSPFQTVVAEVDMTSDGRPMMSFDEFRERIGRGESVRLDQVRRTK